MRRLASRRMKISASGKMSELDLNRKQREFEEVHPTSGYSSLEETANAVTHGVGVLLSIAALVLCVVFAAMKSDPWLVVACAIYGASMVLLYLSSTLYHGIRRIGAKRVFLVLDHSCIYLLIAGTYTPFLLGPVRGPWGWTMFGIVWGCAVIGVVKESLARKRGGWVSSVIYLAMGWMVAVLITKLYATLSMFGFVMLLAGGALYSLGVVFYLMKRMPYSHAIWHLFVVAGSVCHFFSVFSLVYRG